MDHENGDEKGGTIKLERFCSAANRPPLTAVAQDGRGCARSDPDILRGGTRTFVVVDGCGMKVGGAIVLTVGCGRNDGRAPPLPGGEPCLEDAGGEGEVRGGECLASLAGPSNRLSTVARGIADGDGGEAALRETSGNVNAVSSSSIACSQNGTGLRVWGVVGEGVDGAKVGGILNVNLIPPSSSSPKNTSSASAGSSSSRTTLSPDPDMCAESSMGGDSTSTPTSAGSTNGGISSSSSMAPKKPLVNRYVASEGAAEIGGESPMSSRHPKNLSTSSGACCGDAVCGTSPHDFCRKGPFTQEWPVSRELYGKLAMASGRARTPLIGPNDWQSWGISSSASEPNEDP